MDVRTPWLQSHPLDLPIPPAESGVEDVRHQLLALLDDCEGFECERLRWRLHTAGCGQDLWLLREAIYQTVASQHCQAQAQDRMDSLAAAFRRVMPARMAGRA